MGPVENREVVPMCKYANAWSDPLRRSQAPIECYPEQELGMIMDAKTFSLVAGIIFGVVALFHLVRIFAEWTVVIGDWSVPKSVSWIALVVAGGLALLGLRLSAR